MRFALIKIFDFYVIKRFLLAEDFYNRAFRSAYFLSEMDRKSKICATRDPLFNYRIKPFIRRPNKI